MADHQLGGQPAGAASATADSHAAAFPGGITDAERRRLGALIVTRGCRRQPASRWQVTRGWSC